MDGVPSIPPEHFEHAEVFLIQGDVSPKGSLGEGGDKHACDLNMHVSVLNSRLPGAEKLRKFKTSEDGVEANSRPTVGGPVWGPRGGAPCVCAISKHTSGTRRDASHAARAPPRHTVISFS